MKRTMGIGLAVGLAGLSVALGAAMAQQGAKVTPILDSGVTMTGQAIQYPSGKPKILVQTGELAPGAETGNHSHPFPQMTYILQGEVELVFADGSKYRYKAGDALIDAVDTLHTAKNIGSGPAKFLVVAVGEEGKSTTMRPH
jgi:quercetin dioxygenase-like cupin family protein